MFLCGLQLAAWSLASAVWCVAECFSSFQNRTSRFIARCPEDSGCVCGIGGGLGCGEPHVVVVSLSGQKIEQGCPAFFISKCNCVTDLPRLRGQLLAVMLPTRESRGISGLGGDNLRRSLPFDFGQLNPGLVQRHLRGRYVAAIAIPKRQRK